MVPQHERDGAASSYALYNGINKTVCNHSSLYSRHICNIYDAIGGLKPVVSVWEPEPWLDHRTPENLRCIA